ncbi:MAG: two-component regulator propeller domain-containing protein [Bacteroidota bacterium]|nr:two-component regulator propeller domain-containing protein [Bacteroidota bacterium]
MPLFIFGQNEFAAFQHLTLENGLFQNYVISNFRDSRGFIWTIYNKGFSIYDGYTFKKYNSKSFETDFFDGIGPKGICEDINGNIWMGSNKGLVKYNLKQDRFDFVLINDTLINKGINYVSSGKDEFIWLFNKYGVLKFNVNTLKYKQYVHDSANPNSFPKNGIMVTLLDEDGTFWFSNWDQGITKYNPETDDFITYKNNPSDPNSVFTNPIFCMTSDNKDQIWLGSLFRTDNASIGVFNKKTKKFKKIKYNNNDIPLGIFAMDTDLDGNIWMGSMQDLGIYKYDQRKNKFEHFLHNGNNSQSISENNINSIFIDKENKLWAGTPNKGLNVLDLNLKDIHFYDFSKYSAANGFNMISWDFDNENNLWLVTNNGLFKFNMDTEEITKIPLRGFEKNLSNVFYCENAVYVKVNDKILKVDIKSLKVKEFKYPHLKNNELLTMYKDKNGNLYAAYNYNLYSFKSGDLEGNPTLIGTSENKTPFVNFIEIEKYCYISMEGKLFRINKKDLTSESLLDNIGANNSLNSITTLQLIKDTLYVNGLDHEALFNVRTNSLIKIRKNFVVEGTEEIITRNYHYNDTSFCINSHFGVFIYNKYTNQKSKIDLIDIDQMDGNNMIKSPNGRFYLAVSKGILSFDPKKLEKYNASKPIIALTDFYLFNEKVNPDSNTNLLKENIIVAKEIILTHDQSIFSLEMTLLNFGDTKLNQYRYILEGFETKWNYIGSRKVASFTSLPSGEYTFKYAGANQNGIWSDTKSIKIIVLPPFWETWWFRLLILIGIAILVYLIIVVRTRNIKKQKEELETQVILRTAEISAQKEEILTQKEEIEIQQDRISELYKDVTDSIHTAQAIQESILPPNELLKQALSESFVLYLPKDIVSGDLYWIHYENNLAYVAAVDCTGHGVAGAFMSLIANNLLNRIIIESPGIMPNEMLDKLSKYVIKVLHQESEKPISKDGMDISVCLIDYKEGKLHFSGANNALYKISNGQLEIQKADNNSVGLQIMGKVSKFTNHTFDLMKGDQYYLFSDGFAGQFGGNEGFEKMKYVRFREALLSNCELSMEEQKIKLHNYLKDWMLGTEQTDDILVIGFKVV